MRGRLTRNALPLAAILVALLLGNAAPYAAASTSGLAPPPLAFLARAGTMAAQHPRRAADWLDSHLPQSHALVSRDGTIEVLRPGAAPIAILPRQPRLTHVLPLEGPSAAVHAGAARALVLEPFAGELSLGSTAGGAEMDALQRAGYAVYVRRDGGVTVPVLETLGNYSAVYMETHSGTLPGGDAIIATGETDFAPYASMAPTRFGGDGSLMPALVAGDPTHRLYVAVTSTFIRLHVGRFPPDSIVFLNGCSLLQAPLFWQTLQSRGVASLISWNEQTDANVADPAGAVVVQDLMAGDTVEGSMQAASNAGLDVTNSSPPAHLGFDGDGGARLSIFITPTPTLVSATPVAAPPARVHVRLPSLRFGAESGGHGYALVGARVGMRVAVVVEVVVRGSLRRCRSTGTFTLSLGRHSLRDWTRSTLCQRVRHETFRGIALLRRGVYTFTAGVQLNDGAHAVGQARLRVR